MWSAQFISNIDGGSQLLSIKLPPEPSLMPFYIAVAYAMLACDRTITVTTVS